MRVLFVSVLTLLGLVSAAPTFDPYAFEPGHSCDTRGSYSCTLEGDMVVCGDSPLGPVWYVIYCPAGTTCGGSGGIYYCR